MAETEEEPLHPSQQKSVCVLKASIHCEGCKRKVKKILTHLHGVESVDVDTKQQKVTVTGNVHPDTLINKLAKSGKHASLWPQFHDSASTNAGNTKQKQIIDQSNAQVHHPPVKSPSDENPRESQPLPKVVSPPAKKTNVEGGSKPGKGVASATTGGGDGGSTAEDKVNSDAPPAKTTDIKEAEKEEEEKKEKKKDEGCSAAGESPDTAAEKSEGSSNAASGKSAKKKKKKGQSEGSHSEDRELPGPPTPSNESSPRHPYPLPHHYYTPPPPAQHPVYAVSYNTAYPTTPSTYTTSYYAAPPPYGYSSSYMNPAGHEPPSDVERNPRQPLDSFEMFSDENPNGCYVM